MTACVKFAPMIGARPGELSDDDARAFAEHLATCEACQARVADEDALSGLLAEASLAEASARDLSRFADGVLARIPEYAARAPTSSARAEAERTVRPEPVEGRGVLTRLSAWARRHRAAAFASAFIPAAAAAALVVYLTVGVGRSPEQQASLDISVGDRGAMVLETNDGPIVLLGASDSEGT